MGLSNNRKPNSPLGMAKVNGPSPMRAMKAKLATIKNEIVALEQIVVNTQGKQPLTERSEMLGILNEIRAIRKDIENELEKQIEKLRNPTSKGINLRNLESTIQEIIKKNYKKIEIETQKLKKLVKNDSETVKKIEKFEQAAVQQQKEKLVLSSGVNQAIATTSNVPQQSQTQEKPEVPKKPEVPIKSLAQATDISGSAAGPSSQVEDNTQSDTVTAAPSEIISPPTKEIGTMTEETQAEADVKNMQLHTMQDQLGVAEKQLFDLAGNIEGFKRDVTQRDSQIADLMAEKEKLALTINSLETKSAENLDAKTGVEEQLKVQGSELEAVKKNASQATEALSKLQESFNNIKDTLRAEQENFAEYKIAREEEDSHKQQRYQAHVDAVSAQVTAKQSALEQMQTSNQGLLDNIKQLTTDLNQIKASKNVEAEQRIENLARENTALSQRISALEDQLAAEQENKPQPLSTPSVEDQERVANLTGRVAELEIENTRLQEIQDQLQTDLVTFVEAGAEELLRTTYPHLLDEIRELRQQMEDQKTENTYLINKAKQDAKDSQSLLEEADEDSGRLSGEIAQLKDQASQQRKQFEEIQKRFDVLNAEKAGLEREKQTLTQDKQALDTKLTKANSDISQLNERVEILSRQENTVGQDNSASKWSKEREALIEQLKGWESKYSELEQSFTDLQTLSQKLRDELQASADKQRDLEDELSGKNNQLSNLEKQLTIARSKLQQEQGEKQKVETERDEYKQEASEQRQAVEQLTETHKQVVTGLEKQLHETNETSTQQAAQVLNLTTENAGLSGRVSTLEGEKEGLQNQLAGKQTTVEQLSIQIKDLENTLGDTQGKLEASEKRVNDLVTEKTDLAHQLAQADQKLSTQETQQQNQVELLEKRLQEARNEKAALEQQVEGQAGKIDELGKALRAEEDKLLEQREFFQLKEAGLHSKVEELKEESGILNGRLNESRLQNKRLAEESDANTAELKDEIQQQSKRIKVQENQLMHAQGMFQRVQEEKGALEQQLETSESKGQELTTALAGAQRTIEEQQGTIEILRMENPVADKKDENKPLVNNVVDNAMVLELSELKTQNERLQSERDDLARKVNDLQNDLGDMDTSQPAVRSQIGEGTSLSLADEFALEEAQSRNAELEKQTQKLQSNLEQAESKVEELTGELAQANQAKVNAEQKQSELEGGISEKDAQVESLTGLNAILEQRIGTLQTTLEQAQEGVGQAKVNAIKQERQLQEANEALAQANENKLKAEADAKAKGDALEQAQSEKDRLGQQMQGLQNNLQQVESKVTALTGELAQASDAKATAEADAQTKGDALEQAQSEKDRLGQQMQGLQNNLQQVESKVTALTGELAQASDAKATAEADAQTKGDALEQAQSEKDRLGQQMQGLQNNLQQAESKVKKLEGDLTQASDAKAKAEADAQAKGDALKQAKLQAEKSQEAFEASQKALQQEQAEVAALSGKLAEQDRLLSRLEAQQRNLQNNKENLETDNPVLRNKNTMRLMPEEIKKRRHATDRKDLKGEPEMPSKRSTLRLSDTSNKHGEEEGFAETEQGGSSQDHVGQATPESIELDDLSGRGSVSSHHDSDATLMNSSGTSTADLAEEDEHEQLITQIVHEKFKEMKKTDPNLSLTDQDLGSVIKAVLAEANADTTPEQIGPIADDKLGQFKADKAQKIDQILESLTPQVINDKLLEIAQSAFSKEFHNTGYSEALTYPHAEVALQNLNGQLSQLADQNLADYKEQLRRKLNSRSLATLNNLEKDAAMDELLSIESDGSTLKGRVEQTAVTHAQACLDRFKAADKEIFQVFKAAAQGVITARQGEGALSLDINANTLADKTMQNSATGLSTSALIDKVLDIHKANPSNEQQAESQVNAMFADNKDKINLAVEQTLAALEAHEKDKQAKQAVIDRLFEKIDCDQVSKALVDYARPILLKKLDEEGYLLNRVTDEQLEQTLYNLKPSTLDLVKQKLAATLIEEKTTTQINALAGRPDQVIEQLIHTQINQTSLAKQAENLATKLAQQEIDSYKDKTAQDLENYYQSTEDFIKNSAERLHLTMEDVATSREIRDFAREDKTALESILKLINNGKFAEKKRELQEKSNELGLASKDKKSYEQAIKSIEGICAQADAIPTRIDPLEKIEAALNVIIAKNDLDSRQAIVKVESPSHFFKVVKTEDELVEARRDFSNKLSPEISNAPYGTVQDYKRTHTTVEFDTDSTLLEAIRVKTPRNLFKFKKEGEITLTYKAVKKEHVIEFSVDSVNANSRPSFIKKNIKNIDFIRSSTQGMLELAQGTGEGPENKGTGILVLNTNDPNWKKRYALIKAHEALFPKQHQIPVLLKDPRLLLDKSISAKLQQLKAKFIKEYETLAPNDKHVDGANTQTKLFTPVP